MFDVCNVNKKSVVLDLKKDADIKKFKSLLVDADVFITNTRVDGLARLNLDYDSIKAEFPHLI